MLLQVEDLHKDYPSGTDDGTVPVLKGLSLELAEGDSMAVMGPSGSGKSTLLNILGTLDRPTSGSVRLDDEAIDQLADREQAELRRSAIGFVFQLHHLLPQCSVLENVLLPTLAGPHARSTPDDEQRARDLIEHVGLTERSDYRPWQLSGGERQRCAVVRALINSPRLVLADEPTGSLDHDTACGLMELLATLNRDQGVSMIMVTHAEEMAGYMQRISRLQNGKLEPAVPDGG